MVARLTAVPVGLFGLVISTTSGCASRTAATAVSGSMVKSSRRGNCAPLAVGVAGVLGIHRVRRGERQHSPTRSGERQQHVQHDLVAAIGGPDLLGTQSVAEVTSQVATQRQRVTFWVAVHRASRPRRQLLRSR